jgi:hypothetical protein
MPKLYRLLMGERKIDPWNPVFPCIPHHTLPDEDRSILRICTSTSLDGCLTGIGLNRIAKNGIESGGWGEDVFLPFTVLVFYVDWKDPWFLPTCEVSKYVPDAFETNECWLLEPMLPDEVNHLWLVNGKVLDEHSLVDGRYFEYPSIRNSVWSEKPRCLNPWFAEDLGFAQRDPWKSF